MREPEVWLVVFTVNAATPTPAFPRVHLKVIGAADPRPHQRSECRWAPNPKSIPTTLCSIDKYATTRPSPRFFEPHAIVSCGGQARSTVPDLSYWTFSVA